MTDRVPLGSLRPLRRFRFRLPAWGVDWTGVVVRQDWTADVRRVTVVRMDDRHGRREEAPWNPDVMVEDLGE